MPVSYQARIDVVKVTHTRLNEVLTLEPRIFSDKRGFFFESYNTREFERVTGLNPSFVQENHGMSKRGVLRGLHYQIGAASQAKLIRVLRGEMFDVAVDIRKNSPSFGQWVGAYLSEDNKRQMWIPVGFAHGILCLSDVAEFTYKTTSYYSPEHERCICWDDPAIGIDWPLKTSLELADRDRVAPTIDEAELFP